MLNCGLSRQVVLPNKLSLRVLHANGKKYAYLTRLLWSWLASAVVVCMRINSLWPSDTATPYGYRDPGQHWLRNWLVAQWHQAITWTIVDFLFLISEVLCLAFTQMQISQWVPKLLFCRMILKIRLLKLHPPLPRASESTCNSHVKIIFHWAFGLAECNWSYRRYF